ncbi:MAG: hypothetical protein HY819_01320 [Acidobacteria bacterium]|nr:hypothetical protein [Acidobacteriota bacterium]
MLKLKSHVIVLIALILLFAYALVSNSSIKHVNAATPQGAERIPTVTLYPTSTVLRRDNTTKLINLTGLVESVTYSGVSIRFRPAGPKATACPVFSETASDSIGPYVNILVGNYPVGSLTLYNVGLLKATSSTPLGDGNCGLTYEAFHRLSTGYVVSLGVKNLNIAYTVKNPR